LEDGERIRLIEMCDGGGGGEKSDVFHWLKKRENKQIGFCLGISDEHPKIPRRLINTQQQKQFLSN